MLFISKNGVLMGLSENDTITKWKLALTLVGSNKGLVIASRLYRQATTVDPPKELRSKVHRRMWSLTTIQATDLKIHPKERSVLWSISKCKTLLGTGFKNTSRHIHQALCKDRPCFTKGCQWVNLENRIYWN